MGLSPDVELFIKRRKIFQRSVALTISTFGMAVRAQPSESPRTNYQAAIDVSSRSQYFLFCFLEKGHNSKQR